VAALLQFCFYLGGPLRVEGKREGKYVNIPTTRAKLAALLLPVSLVATGCATGPVFSQSMHEAELVKSATFDHGCPVEKIHLLSTEPRDGAFLVNVCGEERTYHRVGTMYYDVERHAAPSERGAAPAES